MRSKHDWWQSKRVKYVVLALVMADVAGAYVAHTRLSRPVEADTPFDRDAMIAAVDAEPRHQFSEPAFGMIAAGKVANTIAPGASVTPKDAHAIAMDLPPMQTLELSPAPIEGFAAPPLRKAGLAVRHLEKPASGSLAAAGVTRPNQVSFSNAFAPLSFPEGMSEDGTAGMPPFSLELTPDGSGSSGAVQNPAAMGTEAVLQASSQFSAVEPAPALENANDAGSYRNIEGSEGVRSSDLVETGPTSRLPDVALSAL